MNLRNRLDVLRRDGGRPVAAADPDRPPQARTSADLLARIDRLRVRPAPRPAGGGEAELAERLAAAQVAEGVLHIERRVDWTDLVPDPLGKGAVENDGWPLPAPTDPARLWFFDTETNGLAGGTGTIPFLVGFARLDAGGLHLNQYLLTGYAGEAAMLERIGESVGPGTGLVSYNGKRFDLPLLATRLRLHGQVDRLAALQHADLLYPVRRIFAARWPDCRLVTAERRLLGQGREGDLPGSQAPLAWVQWLRRQDPRGLLGVVAHNRRDLVALVRLWQRLREVYADPAGFDTDLAACARLYLERARPERAHRLLAENRHRLDAEGLRLLADLYRRRRDWARAVDIWQLLARAGCQRSLSALARYHEHRARDPGTALRYARCLEDRQERDRRVSRLRRKLQRSGPAPASALSGCA